MKCSALSIIIDLLKNGLHRTLHKEIIDSVQTFYSFSSFLKLRLKST